MRDFLGPRLNRPRRRLRGDVGKRRGEASNAQGNCVLFRLPPKVRVFDRVAAFKETFLLRQRGFTMPGHALFLL